ncbi:hypothetical protein N7466_010308 [Penicillium verhagenii]|uniref:uncharacterized protein n=1 Tax=Penicillium verhagenii TaxID=1562060 RepID=UPI0025458FE4|nr:uncharacterized protein N7466_010308 [Penicillium verhagenii]KAJ5919365.1 hypothetical protein N7466_010308 [Penicillium verhagenii]
MDTDFSYIHEVDDDLRGDILGLLIDTRFRARQNDGRNAQQAIEDTIMYLSAFGPEIFEHSMDIIWDKELFRDDVNVFYGGPRMVAVGPPRAGQGRTIVLDMIEMVQLPESWFIQGVVLPDLGFAQGFDTVDFRGLTAQTLASLTRKAVGELVSAGKETDCAICRENVAANSDVIVLPCEHWFCVRCITTWLRDNNSCPMCRHTL